MLWKWNARTLALVLQALTYLGASPAALSQERDPDIHSELLEVSARVQNQLESTQKNLADVDRWKSDEALSYSLDDFKMEIKGPRWNPNSRSVLAASATAALLMGAYEIYQGRIDPGFLWFVSSVAVAEVAIVLKIRDLIREQDSVSRIRNGRIWLTNRAEIEEGISNLRKQLFQLHYARLYIRSEASFSNWSIEGWQRAAREYLEAKTKMLRSVAALLESAITAAKDGAPPPKKGSLLRVCERALRL